MPAASQPTNLSATRRFLPVTLAGQIYGIPCPLVWMFSHARHLQRLPGGLPPVQGVLYSAGRLIPVLNLRRKYHLPGSYARNAPIIVVPLHLPDEPQFPVGLLVDGINPVIEGTPAPSAALSCAPMALLLPCLESMRMPDFPVLDCDQVATLKLNLHNLILAA